MEIYTSDPRFVTLQNRASDAVTRAHNEKRRLNKSELRALSDLLNYYEKRCSDLFELIDLGATPGMKAWSAAYKQERSRTGVLYKWEG